MNIKTTSAVKAYLLLPLLLAACSPAMDTVSADYAAGSLSCSHQDVAILDFVRENLIVNTAATLPSPEDLTSALLEKTAQKAKPLMQTELSNLMNFYLQEVPQVAKAHSSGKLLLALSSIESGNNEQPWMHVLRKKNQKLNANLKLALKSISCQNPLDEKKYQAELQASAENALSVDEAGRRVLSVAYQSCGTKRLPAMTTQTDDVSGIEIIGTHADGIGKKRIIGNLSEVQRTHYYVKDENYPDPACLPVKANPLIYDYGGKPYASTTLGSPLDFFRNAGDGTQALGFDCSGFVVASLLTSGRRLAPNRSLKGSDVYSFGSSSFVEPQNNGLSCLERIKLTPELDLQPGDIMAVYGHIVIIESVGQDPWGHSRVSNKADCSKLSSKNFDFTLIQSSNSKNGIGLNKFAAADYLDTSEKMRLGFEAYAKASCEMQFTGQATTPKLQTAAIIRHKNTAECLGPRVAMQREACVNSCF